MKIADLQTFVVDGGWRNLVFVKLVADDGTTGLGEGTLEFNELTVEKAIQHLAHLVIGQNPFRTEAIWESLYREPFWRGGPVITSALSAIDQALWDIKGKVLGVPVYELLGGRTHERLRAYANAWYTACHTPDDFARRARETVARGFSALKWDPFGPSSLIVERAAADRAVDVVAAVREAVGRDVDLLVECHGRFSPTSAIALAKRLEEFTPFWYEEPVPPDNVDALAKVAGAVSLPIATGERLYTKFGFRELLEKQAAAIIQPDVCHCGGITELKKIAAMAETYYVPLAPHNPNGPVSQSAVLQVDATIPNFLIQEHFLNDPAWIKDLVKTALRVEHGYYLLPELPGLGVELNEEVARAHPYHRSDFNLFAEDWEKTL